MVKKTILGLLFVLLTLGTTPSAFATPAFYKCTVNLAGISSNGGIFIRMSHDSATPAFTKKFFRASTNVQNEALAAALAAIVSNLTVTIFADPLLAAPTVEQFYLRDD